MSEPVPTSALTATAAEAAVGAVLDGLRSFRHSYWTPALLGLIMLFDSWDSIAIAYAMPTMSAEWRLDPLTMGYLISVGYGGQFLGAVCLGAVAERFGRMPVFLGAVTIMCALAIGCALAQDYYLLMAFRLVQGVMIGGALAIAVTYVNELAPTKTRGRYFGIFQTLAICGFAIASISSAYVIPHLGWRWMFGIGAAPIFLLPLAWATLPESPRWLARNGRLQAANRALARLGGMPAAPAGDCSAPSLAGPVEPRLNVLILVSAPFRARTLTITLLWFMTLFTSFGLTTWVPSIYVKVFHIPVQRALTYSAITSVAIFLTLASSGYLIDRFGRRPFAFGGLLATAFAMLFMAIFRPAQELLLFALCGGGQIAIFFGVFVLWPYTAETYPTNVRALAMGYGSSVGRGASMITPLFVGFVLAQGAPIAIVFTCFGLSALGALLIWALRTHETAGKPLVVS